jgi:Mn-dependent DtxR family transcriptional regulator
MAQATMANPLCDLTRVEDYLEVVYELIKTKGYARPIDIAQRLDAMGLVVYERYRGLTLTEKGEDMARVVRQKHNTIIKFLQILGV